MRIPIITTLALLASACSGLVFKARESSVPAQAPAVSNPSQPPPSQGAPASGSQTGSNLEAIPEGVDVPNNVSGAALICHLTNTVGTPKSVDLGCLFTANTGERVPKEDVAENLRFYYTNSDEGMSVSKLDGGPDYEVIYRVGGPSSADAVNGALNLQLTVVIENSGQPTRKITALARTLIVDRWLLNGDSISDSGGCIDDSCVMIDLVTAQNWVRSSTNLVTFPDAASECDNLEYLGHTDWRLPAEVELYFAVNGGLPAQAPVRDRLIRSFPVTPIYWSGTRSKDQLWVIRFDGVVSSLPESAEAGVICVR